MGPVKHIVMLDAEHGMYTKSYYDGEHTSKLSSAPLRALEELLLMPDLP